MIRTLIAYVCSIFNLLYKFIKKKVVLRHVMCKTDLLLLIFFKLGMNVVSFEAIIPSYLAILYCQHYEDCSRPALVPVNAEL